MKFGHNLPRNQVPEWAPYYINYKGLKKLIKAAAQTTETEREPDLAEFLYSLDRNLEDVDRFYNRKYWEFSRRLRIRQDRYGSPGAPDKDELEDLIGALLELRGQLRKLQWYGEVNRRGFVKITKKLDKKIPKAAAQQPYLSSKVDPKPFATNIDLTKDLKTINDWLSTLAEVKDPNQFDGVQNSHALHRVVSRTNVRLESATFDAVDQAIRSNDGPSLEMLLKDTGPGQQPRSLSYQALLLNLLQHSISSRSRDCIGALLPQIVSLDQDDDLNNRNCIHRLVIAIGRSKMVDASQNGVNGSGGPNTNASTPILVPGAPMLVRPIITFEEEDNTMLLGKNDEPLNILDHLLNKLPPHQRAAISTRDSYGRLPLHYAAQYGLIAVCQIIIKYMQDWGQFDVSDGIDSAEWQDFDGNAPLHLSVIGGHPSTTEALLQAESLMGESETVKGLQERMSKFGAVLALAAKANHMKIVRFLVAAGADLNYQDNQGETALHVAARFGHVECAKAILEGSATQKANLELPEKYFAWTPLFVACVDGHLPFVDILIEAGANLEQFDVSGWTAQEHAALRGHLDIARRLATLLAEPVSSVRENGSPTSELSTSSPYWGEKRLNGNSKDTVVGDSTKPIKSFGHRYLTNESMVLVSLGSMDLRKNTQAVQLDDIRLSDANAAQLDTALSLVISATGATGEPTVVDLPVQENVNTDPMRFMTTDAAKVKLLFDIVPTYGGSKVTVIGRGVAVLSAIKPSFGSKRITLQGDVSVPIIAAATLDVIGTVNFNFLIITPFTHPNMAITENHTYWKSISSTQVIGHRGLGKNMASYKSLQLGENTIQSFIAAANLGANYVEFDVQLTKDHVPVIYHDFIVSETGIDAPVHTLTLEQFLHVGDSPSPRPSWTSSRPPSPPERRFEGNGIEIRKPLPNLRPRSYSLSSESDKGAETNERIKHTRDFKLKGYKANSRGNVVQAPFTTLEEMFKKLPESIGFNIEMKYPMLQESEAFEMDTYAVELNSFVDTVLAKVYDLGKKRNIIFSSFHPDICLLLSFKQPSIPILFLTEGGTLPIADIRASSLQEAIRFASRWNLLGIVTAAEPLVICPRLVKVVKQSGLVCVSYGTPNNEPKNVKLQVKEGIDAVIVDSVLAIRRGLTETGNKADAEKTGSVDDESRSTNGIVVT